MTPTAWYLVFFGLGIICQLGIFLRDISFRENSTKIGLSVGIALLGGMSPGKREHDYNLVFHILFSFLFLVVNLAIAFRKTILPTISEQTLLQLVIVFWYFLATRLGISSIIHHWSHPIYIVLFIPTAATLVVAFTPTILSSAAQLLLYVWYLIIIVIMTAFHFKFRQLFNLTSSPLLEDVNAFECFTSGIVFTYLVSNSFYLLNLIPLPGKHESFANRWKDVCAFASLLIEKYADDQLKVWEACLILFLQGGLLALNYHYNVISDFLAINLALILTQVLAFQHDRILKLLQMLTVH